MTRNVIGVQANETLRAALRKMLENKIGGVLVFRGEEAVGILTESDISKRILDGYQVVDMPVERVMSSPLITVEPTMQVWKAFETMLTNHIRRLPVVTKGNLAGIVTERDLFKWIVRVTYSPNIPQELQKVL